MHIPRHDHILRTLPINTWLQIAKNFIFIYLCGSFSIKNYTKLPKMSLANTLKRQYALLAVLLLFDVISHANIVRDRDALISIKNQINMEPSSNPLSNWDRDSSSPCNWTRIVCNRSGQRVVEVNLSGLQLSGSISPYIGNLSFLISLQLQQNQFAGELPQQLGNLVRLRILNVSSNSISGAIPSNVSSCKELRILDLSQNEISGGIPEEISQLKQLQVLNLARNHLSDAIISSIANISSLVDLNLGTNALGGLIPSDLARLQNLEQLDLTINNLTGSVPPSIYNISSLVYLALASNNLWGELPYNIGMTLPNLLGFNFCFNKFTGTIPESLHNLTRMRIIRIAHNLLHGSVPPGLGNLPDLEMYNIGFNKMVNSGENGFSFLESLANSTRLSFLAVDYNLFEGEIPKSIGNLSKVLKKFYMGGNRIYGSIPSSIGQLTGLELLNMSYGFISGEIPPEIGQLKELQVLALAGNRLSGKIPNYLGNLRNLNKIDMSENELVGNIPTTLGNFQNLLSLDLSKNKLDGSIPKEIFHLSSLSLFLNLSQNLLSGFLPEEVGLLENVVTIDISENNLSGGIPNSIGDCRSLEHMLLAKNMLSGQIPSTLGDLKGLETLDLSSNLLSGSIPSDLGKLQALEQLNFSFNNLEGKIPSGGIFAQPSGVHLKGNQKLCLQSTCESGSSNKRRVIIAVTTTTIATILSIFTVVVVLFVIRKGKAKNKATSESFRGQHQLISYDELRRATNNFDKENLIGTGSFGSVYKGFLREGRPVAVKVIDTETTGYFKSFLAECTALKHLRHRNLVKVITSCSSIDFRNVQFLALIYEFMCNGSVDDWITGKRTTNGEWLNIFDRLSIVIDIASAINYLHNECEAPIVHCDIKPSNVLMDLDMTAKLGDFGLARFLMKTNASQPSSSSIHTLIGSIGYIPPEYGVGAEPSTAGDVYSFGILLLELFTGKSPRHESFTEGLSLKKWVQMSFPSNMEKLLDQEILKDDLFQEGKFQDLDCLIKIIDVGLSCVTDSPEKRISIKDVLYKLKGVKGTV